MWQEFVSSIAFTHCLQHVSRYFDFVLLTVTNVGLCALVTWLKLHLRFCRSAAQLNFCSFTVTALIICTSETARLTIFLEANTCRLLRSMRRTFFIAFTTNPVFSWIAHKQVCLSFSIAGSTQNGRILQKREYETEFPSFMSFSCMFLMLSFSKRFCFFRLQQVTVSFTPGHTRDTSSLS